MTLAQAGGQGQPSLFTSLLPLILIVVVMYFLLIRPQQKKQKAHQTMVGSLKTGDKIVTSGGVHGEVAGIDEKGSTLYVKIANEVKIKIDRHAVGRVISGE